jgi:long-chain acyl-CoA synthetase
MANRFANSLLENGVQCGDRVGIYLPTQFQAVVAIFGVLKAGAVFVVINSTTKSDKLTYILNNCSAAAVITEGKHADMVVSMVESVPSLKVWILSSSRTATAVMNGGKKDTGNTENTAIPVLHFHEFVEKFPTSRPRQTNIDLDLACLIYTSGSTGKDRVKALMLPEKDSSPDSLSLARELAESHGLEPVLEDITPALEGFGCYRRRDVVVRRSFLYMMQTRATSSRLSFLRIC